MPKKNRDSRDKDKSRLPAGKPNDKFHIEFLNAGQRQAWSMFQQHDVLFMLGPAGVGKTFLAMAFAIQEILNKNKRKIILTRPIVEAEESLGFLPGDFYEKVNPYMMPLYDATDKLLGNNEIQQDIVHQATEVVPLAFMRGRSFGNSICILDEAQNCTYGQLKLFLTRFEETSKLIITGDPDQSDLGPNHNDLMDVWRRLESVHGISTIKFSKECIVRHPLVSDVITKLEE